MSNSATAVRPPKVKASVVPLEKPAISEEFKDFAIRRLEQAEGIASYLEYFLESELMTQRACEGNSIEHMCRLAMRRVNEISLHAEFNRHWKVMSQAGWVSEVYELSSMLDLMGYSLTENGDALSIPGRTLSILISAVQMSTNSIITAIASGGQA